MLAHLDMLTFARALRQTFSLAPALHHVAMFHQLRGA
jgi:hypothetical protein